LPNMQVSAVAAMEEAFSQCVGVIIGVGAPASGTGPFLSPVFPIGKPLQRVEPRGIEPLTSALPARRSPS
jgi:hypothetical protein